MRCVKILAMARFVCPDREVRIAGGREMHLRSLQGLALHVANSLFLGDYLTSEGQSADADLELIRDHGFTVLGSPTPRAGRARRGDARPGQAPPRRGHRRRPECLTARADELLAYDREHVWHPYTSMTEPTPVRLVESRVRRTAAARGRHRARRRRCRRGGRRSTGTPCPSSTPPLADQARRMAHVMFGGLTHSPAIRLAAAAGRRSRRTGSSTSSSPTPGSVSVEVALKMVLQHQRGLGHPERTRMLTVRGGYHGDTFGCMSVCDPVGGMHSMFSEVLPQQVFADQPPAPGGDVEAWAAGFRALAAEHARELAGIIVEPLLQGAGGMFVYDAACLRVMREVADEHGLVLVFDEIATGFGRTGTFFAAEAAGVRAGRDVRRQGAHRRLPLAGRRAVHRRGRPRALRVGVRRADARPDLHGQPAGLLGRARQPRPARVVRLVGQRGPASAPGSPPGWSRSAGCRVSPTCARSARWVWSSSTTRSTWSRRPRRPSRRACGCGRSATSSTRCRRTSRATRTWPASAPRSSGRWLVG